jgi:hypothetical protein
MFIVMPFMFIDGRLPQGGQMATAKRRVTHKHFQLDSTKIRRAQNVLRARTETETIERALDAILAEDERNRLVEEANERFLSSGVNIRDVYGKLED